MSALGTALAELWGLFVEDPGFTVGLAVALGVGGVLLPAMGLPPALRGPALFVALAVALVDNVVRAARR